MPVERHVLLPAACGSGPMELMLLPAGEDALEVWSSWGRAVRPRLRRQQRAATLAVVAAATVQAPWSRHPCLTLHSICSLTLQEHQYQAMLAGGARLHWRHHSSDLSWQPPNQLASRLAQTQVWGDATLVLPPRPEPELRQQVQQIAAAHLPGVQCRLSGGWAADGDARGVDAAGRERRGRRQQEQLLRMLRRSAGGPEEPCMSAASAAPPTPASQGPSAGHATQQQRPSTTSSVPAEQEHEARVYECEPRQQLLWSIAGRATSLSWQCSAGTAAAGSAGVPAAAASTAPLAAAACLPSKAPEPDSTAKAPAAAAVLPPKHRCSLDSHPPWAELQPELLAVVLAHAGWCALRCC